MATKKPTQLIVKAQRTHNGDNTMKKVLEARAARFQSATSSTGSSVAPVSTIGSTTTTTPGTTATPSVDQEKFAARAARFADVQGASGQLKSTPTTSAKGTSSVSTPVDTEKLAQRAARFKELAPNPSVNQTTTPPASVAGGPTDEALKRRAERFAKMNATK